MRRPWSLDASTIVHQLPVDHQRKVILGYNLVMIAYVRHGDKIVRCHFPASLYISITVAVSLADKTKGYSIFYSFSKPYVKGQTIIAQLFMLHLRATATYHKAGCVNCVVFTCLGWH